MDEQLAAAWRLEAWLRALGSVQIAVSGGVDSMTLSLVAGRVLGTSARMFHARSPAVPPEATARVERVADIERWDLRIVDAGEFEDESYLSNPYRRCFHCKSHLYAALAAAGPGALLSGTNMDDLGDFRPGLEAARLHQVRHPFVECGIDKAEVRRICSLLGFEDIAELPASPCLSSRVQTGIRIRAEVLEFVDRVETRLRDELPTRVARCRIRPEAIAIELDARDLARLTHEATAAWAARIQALAQSLELPHRVVFEPYRMGSSFVPSDEPAPRGGTGLRAPRPHRNL